MLKMYIDEINSALNELEGLLILYSLNNTIYETLVGHQNQLVDLKNNIETTEVIEVSKLKRDTRRTIGGFYRFINQIS